MPQGMGRLTLSPAINLPLAAIFCEEQKNARFFLLTSRKATEGSNNNVCKLYENGIVSFACITGRGGRKTINQNQQMQQGSENMNMMSNHPDSDRPVCRAATSLSAMRFRLYFLVFFSFLLAMPLFPQALWAAGQTGVVFLPLKINSPDPTMLAQQADKTMNEALAGSMTDGLVVMPRPSAEQRLNYLGDWPPTFDALHAVAERETTKPFQYIVAGSLSAMGRQISLDIKVYDLLDPSHPTYYYLDSKKLSELDEAMTQIMAEILSYTSQQFLIADIAIADNERIDSGAILRQIKSRTGDSYDPAGLRSDMKNVFKMGYFDDVSIAVTDSPRGKMVIFAVKEKPVIGTIEIEGTKELKKETVQEAMTITANTIINPKKVRETAANIRALYKSKGFYSTAVTTKLSTPKQNMVDITFVIEEGPKVYVKEIKIIGNQAFNTKELKKVIETSEKGFLSWITESGFLKREVLEQDVGRLTAYYHHHGYIQAKVAEPTVVQEDNWLYITFTVYEGDRYLVGEVKLTGDLIADPAVLLDLLSIREEKFLSRKILRQDILRLTDYYAENGYAFAEANPETRTNDADKRVDITINVHKGDLIHLNRITIKGNTRTRDKVLRREMAIKEQGIFNSKALRTSHQRLQRLDYFEDISIIPTPTADNNMMDVAIEVKEKPTGAFSIGAGYSSVDNLMLMGEISQNNFLGKGQRLALQGNLSSASTRYNLSFTEPHLADSQLLFGIDLYNWARQYDDYTKDSYGGAIRFGYPVWEQWKLGLSYGYDHTDVTDVLSTADLEIQDSKNFKVTSFFKLGLSRDTRNHPYDTTDGSDHSISVKYAGGPLGGDNAFTKVEGSTSWFFPAFLGTTYHLRGVAGQIFKNPDGHLPIYEKFYLGGLSTIRGFNSGQISPLASNGDRVGGDRMWYANVEWIFPLVKSAGLKGLIFFDVGNVYEDSWEIDDVKTSVGLGFRWLSPMGPLRLEWGYNLAPKGDEEQSSWDFSIGGGF